MVSFCAYSYLNTLKLKKVNAVCFFSLFGVFCYQIFQLLTLYDYAEYLFRNGTVLSLF